MSRAQVVSASRAAPAELGARLMMVVARLARDWHAAGRRGDESLTPSRLTAMARIGRAGSITLGELARQEQVQPPTMTRVVIDLEELGLARRQVDDNDRRVVQVRLTGQGLRRIRRFASREDAFIAQHLAGLPEARLKTLAIALDILEELLDD